MEFCPSEYILGGQIKGAGSGKSYIMLWDALGLNDQKFGPRYKLPYYRALIYRKLYKQLIELIDKSRQIYPLVDPGAIFTASNSTWTFSSGAVIRFQFFEAYDQVESLQGISYSYIGCDELGQYSDDRIMKYALSRLRSPEGLKCYFRATSNPSRYPWLRQYFNIDNFGSSTAYRISNKLKSGKTVTKSIKYIQALLSDNPYIGDEYEAQLLLLSDDEKKALLDGRWDAYMSDDGQVYQEELKKLYSENRLCGVTYDPAYPIYTAWDIGIEDSTCILFLQIIGKERHVIRMMLDNNKSIRDYFIPELLKLRQDYGYRYAAHYIPHDSAQRSKWSGDSLFNQISSVLPNCKKLTINSVQAGIQKTKTLFKDYWIDKNCGLYDQLTNYKREWNSNDMTWGKPCHDKYSHAADAFRYLSEVQLQISPSAYSFINNNITTNPFI